MAVQGNPPSCDKTRGSNSIGRGWWSNSLYEAISMSWGRSFIILCHPNNCKSHYFTVTCWTYITVLYSLIWMNEVAISPNGLWYPLKHITVNVCSPTTEKALNDLTVSFTFASNSLRFYVLRSNFLNVR